MKVAIVVPIYKKHRAELKWYEHISLKRCPEVFGGKYPIIFAAPNDRKFDYIPRYCTVETFDPQYFSNRKLYSRMMLSPQFYTRFLAYDYILIYQLDAFVFSDRLPEFCELGYDYIGAPWPWAYPFVCSASPAQVFIQRTGLVGNGGFSLRNVRTHYEILSRHADFVNRSSMGEDTFLSYFGKVAPNEFRVASVKVASQFSFDLLPERFCRRNLNVLPFGCHGWNRFGSKFYLKAFSECGYDLTPHAHLMGDEDSTLLLEERLRDVFKHRLINRINHGHSLIKYLPPGENFFVFLADDQSKVLLQRLAVEGLRIVNPTDIPILRNKSLLRDTLIALKRARVRGLLISLTDDSEVVSAILNTGGGKKNSYGRDFISYWQECLKQTVVLLRQASRPTLGRLRRKKSLV